MSAEANSVESTELPEFLEQGERDVGCDWDAYECPECSFPVGSFCDCPECGWYDAEAWNEAVRRAARERDNVYTGTLEVDA